MDSHDGCTVIVGREYPAVVGGLIAAAAHSIKIVIFDWRVYVGGQSPSVSDFNSAIFAAARRGVKVQALVNSKSILATLKACGVEARHYIADAVLHAKVLIIDDKLAVVGSHNYSNNAFSSNMELSVAFPVGPEQQRMLQFFDRLWGL